jgi:phosphoglycerol geranylgeranyltransferase
VTGVLEYIKKRLKKGPAHVTLIDPDKQSPVKAAEMVVKAENGGTHLILVGGTMGVDHPKLEGTLKAVRRVTKLPMIIFPSTADVLSEHADAILFMSLMNSRDVRYVMREAVSASFRIDRLGLEPLSVGYIVISPGALVGEVGDVDLIDRNDPGPALEYARTAQIFGMNFVYLEGGSGIDEPIPMNFIQKIRTVIDVPLIVGGGIKTPGAARRAVMSGADMVVTGTMVETEEDTTVAIRELVTAMEEGWSARGPG